MNRGDVGEADLGARAGKRPVVILTRGAVIPHLDKVAVAEITTQDKAYPTEVDIDQKANLAKHCSTGSYSNHPQTAAGKIYRHAR